MSIFKNVKPLPRDPIFGLTSVIQQDKNPKKVNLLIGIYHDENLEVKKMRAIMEAEKKVLEREKDKKYLPIPGDGEFLEAISELVFGKSLIKKIESRLFNAQSLGGTGALKIGSLFLAKELKKEVYLPAPTWANHQAIFKSSGMEVCFYPYYDQESFGIDFDKTYAFLSNLPEKSIVLLHACCHNPTGCDFTRGEWKRLSALFLEKNLVPFFDFAYQGFGLGVEEDAFAVRYFAQQGHEMFIAYSCSKTFAIYGERTGALLVLTKEEEVSQNIGTVIKQIVRGSYSNPPRHGESLVNIVLRDQELRRMWEKELGEMRQRINEMRSYLTRALIEKFGGNSFEFLKQRVGFFALLGLKESVVQTLIDKYSIYLTGDGRINLTALNNQNIDYVIDAIGKTK